MSKKGTKYISKEPDAQGLRHYSAEEHQIWADLYARQAELLPNRACPEFLDCLEKLGLPHDQVPQLTDVTKTLHAATGWGVEGVPALISFEKFFALLANKKFPAATFIRTRDEFDYLQEPDIFHEIFGHCPLLMNPAYANFMQKYGEMGLEVEKADRAMLARLYWFTIEFGLMRRKGEELKLENSRPQGRSAVPSAPKGAEVGEGNWGQPQSIPVEQSPRNGLTGNGLKLYGAGIVSSVGESQYALGGTPELKPADLVTIFRTLYRIDIYQPIYFVIESFEQLYSLVQRKEEVFAAIKEAKRLGPFAPTFDVSDLPEGDLRVKMAAKKVS